MKKEKWVKDNQGQLIITAGQVVWTTECEKALADPDQAKAALRHLKKKWISYLNKLTAITCSKLTKIERNKVGANDDWHLAHCVLKASASGHIWHLPVTLAASLSHTVLHDLGMLHNPH